MAMILCVDDEPAIASVVGHALQRLGHTCRIVASVDAALRAVAQSPFDLVLADHQLPDRTGLDLIRMLAAEGCRVPVIIMTGQSSVEHAVASIKSGAIDYLTKPVTPEALEIAVAQALEVVRLRRENEGFRRELLRMRSSRELIGASEPWRHVMETVDAVAPTRATVLLEGESGTGKELLARALHDRSPRSDGPYVSVNCAALPEGLVESALFGHEKGAFTGATVRTAGAFERAHGGTLLLDEISEMRLDLQAKLLRVIQEQEFERVGGAQLVRVDVRILATTNRHLKAEVDAGRFRADLFYRLDVLRLRIPPLRDRPEDIPRLVQYFIQRSTTHLGIEPPTLPPETLVFLQAYPWPGNVRELSNAVERATILSRGQVLTPSAFQGHLDLPSPPTDREHEAPELPAAAKLSMPATERPYDLHTLERWAILRALQATGGHRTKAARLLGIAERTLRYKLKALDQARAS